MALAAQKYLRLVMLYIQVAGGVTADATYSGSTAALLGKCMDLGVVKECDVEVKAETFDEEVDRVLRTAENLRICVNEALKTCDPNQNASAISHLRKITDAVVDLFRLKDLPNTAHTAQAAKNVVTASLLCLLSHYMY
ncbi:hypothetical protein HPB50_006792 [Hyalomma asiaticum]|uniref:Uncharacterized protein n=1 Tax=Hyalomma asiaticum TaxID=266040 RepID=A0ACB7RI69_HYAAI|nr:hypothetical protein HPB50_006792 [Hyalomma asiaticum]